MTATRPLARGGAPDAPAEGLGELLRRLETAPADVDPGGDGHAAGRADQERLIAATIPVPAADPIAVYAAAVEAGLEAALWLRPAEGTAFVGIGRAFAVEPEGPGRFREAEEAWRDLLRSARLDGVAAARGLGPVLIGGLGFTGRRPAAEDPDNPWSPFGPSSLVLPELMLAVTPDGAWLTGSIVAPPAAGSPVTVAAASTRASAAGALERRWARVANRARALTPNPGGMIARPVVAPLTIVAEQPARAAWDRLVGMFAGAVGRGRLDKVVLARRVDLRCPVELDVANALRRLSVSAPESTTYAFRRGERTFLGATPERLVRTEGREFRTVAVAGSIGRGASAAEDDALAAALLASEKDREEHAVVLAAIRGMLAPIADRLEVSEKPAVMTLRHVQHLVTEIEGTLREAYGLLALGERLHPTPAVGGEPRALALSLIDEHEGFDRGWYAGPIGWLGADGDGELCVALRCGIVERTRVTLFAGCGIVADSDPEREWEESRIKLRAVAAALGRPEDEA